MCTVKVHVIGTLSLLHLQRPVKLSQILKILENLKAMELHWTEKLGATLGWGFFFVSHLLIPSSFPLSFLLFFFFSPQSFNIFLKEHGRNTQLRYYIILGFCYLWLWPSIFVKKKKNWTRFLEYTFTLENNTQYEICIYPLVLASCLLGYLWWCS